ncbi:MAG TPA: lysophospholipid acyltransferase family protein [Steroidobacteraceae bacterium]|nr:lysophospholipid acyltransferase family protein [Steroidobacteraceae bacterium]
MNPTAPNSQNPARDSSRSSWWIRVLSRVPLAFWYAFASGLAWLSWRLIPYRRHVVEANLKASFPEWSDAQRDAVIRDYYRGFADMLVEILHSLRLTRAEIERRVAFTNPQLIRDEAARGKPVLLVAAHQCNWEWMLLGLSTQLGLPVDAAYKPLVDSWAEREMLKLRGRFGAQLIPAQGLLGDIIQKRNAPRVIAMVADQEPVSSERRQWLRFLNRDTAFFLGAEEIARTTRYAAFFVRLKRVARGHYQSEFVPLAAAGEKLEPGEFTARYARLVEEQIREAPADWPWSHKRWKLKKPLYQG